MHPFIRLWATTTGTTQNTADTSLTRETGVSMPKLTPVWYKSWLICFVLLLSACHEETRIGYAVGTVLGPGCRSGSYAIQLQGKNSDYEIREHAAYENVVETLNLPEKYQISGQPIYFTFTLPERDPTDDYLTYCTPPSRITIVAVTNSDARDSLPVSRN